MGKGEKRLAAMRNNPMGGWTIEDVAIVCRTHGITLLPPSGGTHYKVAHPSQREILTVVYDRKIKAIYIKRLVKFVDDVTGAGHDH
jgi:hypothetical protein